MRFPLLLALAACACASVPNPPIPAGWADVPHAASIPSVAWRDGRFVAGATSSRGPIAIRVERVAGGAKIVNGTKDVTPAYAAIDSFDYSPDRHEVIFSAKRDKSFDIGLAADDGSEIHWVPEDPADEVNVQWAPVGNKVTYVVRGPNTAFIRTVHIPTSTQLIVPFRFASIRSIAYEPTGQRFAVAYSTPDASDRVDSLKYGGEERRNEVPPAVTLDVEVDWRNDAVLLQPSSIRYGERLPLVIWLSADPFAWSDARAALMRNARVVVAVVKRQPDAAFWKAMGELPLVDMGRVFLVGELRGDERAVTIRGGNDVSAGHYRRTGNFVTAPVAVVESFAAGFIADQLKRTSPPDGHDR